MICKNCGTLHDGQQALPGNGWIELVLWLCWLLPGVIYSIWRRSQRAPKCSACGSRDLVDETTPIGRRLAREHHPLTLTEVRAPAPAAPAPSILTRAGRVLLMLLAAVAGTFLVVWTFG